MNWNMYLFVFQASKNYSPILSKIAVMSLAVFLMFIFPASKKFLRIKKRVMLTLLIFTNDESSRYISSSFFFVITIRQVNCPPDFHNYTGLNGLVIFLSQFHQINYFQAANLTDLQMDKQDHLISGCYEVFCKEAQLTFSQNSHRSTCARVSNSVTDLQAVRLTTSLNRDPGTGV